MKRYPYTSLAALRAEARQNLQRERIVYRALRPGNPMTVMAIAYQRNNRAAVLRDDPKLMIQPAAQAQCATDFILNRQHTA